MFYLMILVLGAAAGFMAGLLGVGGGLIIVPTLAFLLAAQGYDPATIMHVALGTSLASVIFTSLSSVYAHHRHGAVLWATVIRMAPGLLLGTFAGAFMAGQLNTSLLAQVFGVYALLVALQMGSGWKAGAHAQLPGAGILSSVGSIIGVISSFVGIGGGSMSVPYLMWHSVDIRKAVATSAANGLPIAAAGAAGYIVTGWLARGNLNGGWQEWQLGYVHLDILATLVVTSMLFAPLGARVAHRINPTRLKQVFALLMALIGLRMLFF